jgi:general secretion pathway protein C
VVAAGRNSVAILVADGQPAKAFPVGKELSAGVVVKEVHPRYVMLSEGGVLKRIELATDAKPAAEMAAPMQVAPPPQPEPPPQQEPPPAQPIPEQQMQSPQMQQEQSMPLPPPEQPAAPPPAPPVQMPPATRNIGAGNPPPSM